jgi:hypothetical protein
MRSLFVEAVLRNLERGREKEPFIRYIKEKADTKIFLLKFGRSCLQLKVISLRQFPSNVRRVDEAFLENKVIFI